MKLVGQKPRGKSGTDLTLVVLLTYTNLEISRQNMNKLGKEILSVSGMDKWAIFFQEGGLREAVNQYRKKYFGSCPSSTKQSSLDVLLCDRNIIGSSSDIFGYLRKSSIIFEHFRSKLTSKLMIKSPKVSKVFIHSFIHSFIAATFTRFFLIEFVAHSTSFHFISYLKL